MNAEARGAFFLNCLESQMEEDSLTDALKSIKGILNRRLQQAKRQRNRGGNADYFEDEVEEQIIKLERFAEALEIELED